MNTTEFPDPIATHVTGHDFAMLIDGQLVRGQDGNVHTVTDPSTGQPLTSIPMATPSDVDSAVCAAGRAQPGWEALVVKGRSDCFLHFSQMVKDNRERLAMLDSIDCGNPVGATRTDVDINESYLDGWPALAKSMTGEVYPASPGNLHYSANRPYGVVGRITAFNHPVMFAITRPLPSLITGNTLVMKPSDETSLSTPALAELDELLSYLEHKVVHTRLGDASSALDRQLG